jgi:hypothetical protein
VGGNQACITAAQEMINLLLDQIAPGGRGYSNSATAQHGCMDADDATSRQCVEGFDILAPIAGLLRTYSL